MSFEVNGHSYFHGYYLCDGIYPNYATFVKAQESAMKDIERTFGVLKHKCHVVIYVARLYDDQRIATIMYAWIIMHNMIIEAKGRAICMYDETKTVNRDPKFQQVSQSSNRLGDQCLPKQRGIIFICGSFKELAVALQRAIEQSNFPRTRRFLALALQRRTTQEGAGAGPKLKILAICRDAFCNFTIIQGQICNICNFGPIKTWTVGRATAEPSVEVKSRGWVKSVIFENGAWEQRTLAFIGRHFPFFPSTRAAPSL
ncbi:hypothetical protein LXL04_026597 [Taraxacum kok-saghyz]